MHMPIDPELMYCPQCGDEYRAGFARCLACARDLVSGREVLRQRGQRDTKKEPARITADDKLVAVRKGSVVEIKQMLAMLAREGVASLAAADPSVCGKGCCGKGAEMILQVREADLEHVREIFTREYVRSTALADHQAHHAGSVYNSASQETLCPACGCRFMTSSAQCPECGLCFA